MTDPHLCRSKQNYFAVCAFLRFPAILRDAAFCEVLFVAITFPIYEREAPRDANDLMNNSKDTDLSAVSIFAIRDWLDPICFANCA